MCSINTFLLQAISNYLQYLIFSTLDYVLTSIEILKGEVLNELLHLNISKSMEINRISPKLLRYSSHTLYLPIHHLFSLCLEQKY